MTNIIKLDFNSSVEYRDPLDLSKKMNLTDFLNSTTMNIYVMPVNNINLDPEGYFNYDDIRINSWKILSFSGTQIEIDLDF